MAKKKKQPKEDIFSYWEKNIVVIADRVELDVYDKELRRRSNTKTTRK